MKSRAVSAVLPQRARDSLEAQFREKWFIAIRPRDTSAPWSAPMERFRLIPAPTDHYFADPFLLEWDGRHFLFFEDYSFAAARATIAYCEIYPDGSTSEPAVALERHYHLAYPCVVVWDQVVYMLPETVEHGALELFRAPVFPGEFALDRVLMENFNAVDPTIVRWGERLWLFANAYAEGEDPNDRLNLFWADSLAGPWHAHPMNPVVRASSSARPAGAPFEFDGQLIRPAQDCSLRYGHEVVFNRVEHLGTDDYREREIGRIGPDWLPDNLATHTYNRDSRFEAIDGRWLTSERRWLDLAARGVARVVNAPTASQVRGRRGWKALT